MTCPSLYLFSSGGRKNILRKNQYIQRENKALRRSKYLALETVREGRSLNGSVEMEFLSHLRNSVYTGPFWHDATRFLSQS